MGYTVINIECIDQTLRLTNTPALASGGVEEDLVVFSFCPLWEGLKKTAVFYMDPADVYHQDVLNSAQEGECCTIPAEVMRGPGTLYISVFGDDDGVTVRTSGVITYPVRQGAYTLATVPSPKPNVYQALLAQMEELADDRGPAIVPTATGDTIAVTDSTDRQLRGLHLYGKTVQKGTPSTESPADPVSVGAGGSISVCACGKNLFDVNDISSLQQATKIETNGTDIRVYSTTAGVYQGVRTSAIWLKAGTTYTVSFEVSAYASGVARAGFRRADTAVFIAGASVSNITTTGKYSFTFSPTEDVQAYFSLLTTWSTSEVGDVTFTAVQVEIGSTVTNFEPYASGGKLAAQTPNGLPGVPVSYVGNYTDETGQRWVCDELDFERGVRVHNVTDRVFNGAESWVYNDSIGMLTVSLPDGKKVGFGENWAVCSHYPYGAYSNADMLDRHFKIHYAPGSGSLLLYVKDSGFGSATDFKAYLADHPMHLVYMLGTPIETPLTAGEIAAYTAMHSNKPVTTLFNDGGAGMSVSYVADTKAYIDNKFSALEAAILSQGGNI